MKINQICVLLGLTMNMGLSLAQSTFPNIVLDDKPGSYQPCEPSIAIDFLHPDTIVAGAILNRVYYSHDGGETWKNQRLASPYGVFGDPCLLADWQGNLYYLHLSNPGGKGWRDENLLDRIVCQHSADGGKTWSKGGYMGLNHPKDQDKEWAVADPTSGTLYATWTQFDRYNSRDTADKSHIYFSRSDDQGQSWSEALRINEKFGDCLDDDGTTEGAVPAVGPNGEVYVAWALDEQIFFDRSLDGGQTWLEEDRKVADQPGGWTYDIPGISRCNGLPVTTCDLSEGPHRGTIYVNWTDQRHGEEDTDVWLAKSTDGGDTWSSPIRVNDDSSGHHQFLTWLTVDQATGYLYCVFYDRRAYQGDSTDVYLAYSRDGGDSFVNVRISEAPFVPRKSVFFGDYNHIAAHDGRIFPIWTRMDGRNTKVLTARIDAAQLPPSPGIKGSVYTDTEQGPKTGNKLQVVAEFDTRPGNVAVSKDGRVFTTMHPLGTSAIQLFEVKEGNSHVPFPNTDYQKQGAPASDDKIDTPLGIRVDHNNVLWIIDMGQNLGKTRLFGFDIESKKEVFRFDFPEDVAPKGSFIQDLAVDEQNGWVYLADIANPGIVAVNLKEKTARRFSDSVLESEDIDMVIDEKVIYFGGAPARVAVNPITLSADRNTLFFGAMNGTKWYSVPAVLFRDNKEDAEIASAISLVGKKPISDGVATDANGNHYFTNLQEYGVDVLSPSGELTPVLRDRAIDWPDNVAVSKDGWLYIIVNQLHKTPAFTGGDDLGTPPYYIYKYKL